MRCSLVLYQAMEAQTPFFILRQLKEKYLAGKWNLLFAFVDLEKSGAEDWLVKILLSMWRNA